MSAILLVGWDGLRASEAPFLLGPMALMFVAIFRLGDRRESVLYLRGFRQPTLSSVGVRAVEAGLHERYRVIALDNGSIPALRGSVGSRVTTVLLSTLSMGACLLLVQFVGFEEAEAAIWAVWSRIGPGLVGADTLLRDPVAEIVEAGSLLVFVEGVLLLPVALISPPLALSVVGLLRPKRWVVEGAQDLRGLSDYLTGLASFLSRKQELGVRLLVVSADDSNWREAFELLLTHCRICLVDVTDMGEGLAWELGALREAGRATPAFMIRETEFRARAEQRNGQRCVLVHGEPVPAEELTVYPASLSERRAGLRGFLAQRRAAAALRAALEQKLRALTFTA